MSEMVKKARLSSNVKEGSAGEGEGGGDNGKAIDKTCPFQLLPELMEAIFEKLGSEDLQTCTNTCEDWSKLLKSQRNLFQFELVLPILLKMKVLPFKDCLNSRLVCGKWMQGVDNILQNHPSRVNSPDASRVFSLQANRPGELSCPLLQSMERLFDRFGMQMWNSWFYYLSPRCVDWTTDRGFVDQLLGHQRNPFVGRSLTLTTLHWTHYYDLGRSLLERFGKELWFLCYRIDDSSGMDNGPVEWRIRDALLHLSNLKWLQLDVALPWIPDEEERDATLETRMRLYFEGNPLPLLQNLETFSCNRMFKSPPILLSSILEFCCVPETLKRLNLAHSKLKYKSTFIFPNLEELGIRMELKDLGSLKETSPRLKKLLLILTNPAEDDGRLQDIDGGQVFGELEFFQETLIHLCIERELRKAYYSIICTTEFKILLPKLELLVLDCEIVPESLENLRHLQHLGFCNYNDDDEEEVEDDKLKFGRVVPSLKTFQSNGDISKIKM